MPATSADFGFFDKFTLSRLDLARERQPARFSPHDRRQPTPTAINVQLADGKLQVNLVKRWLDDALRVETRRAVAARPLAHVAVTYDGSRVASGVDDLHRRTPLKLKVLLDELNQIVQHARSRCAIGGGGPDRRFHGQIDDVRIYSTHLPPTDDRPAGHARHDRRDRRASLLQQRTPGQVAQAAACTFSPQHAPRARFARLGAGCSSWPDARPSSKTASRPRW